MNIHRIPVTPTPQIFNITLAGREYRITVRWNTAPEGGWWLDIASPDKGEPIVLGIPIVTGVDLLEPYEHLGIGGGIICWSGSSDAEPTYENLGVENSLLFLVKNNG